MILKEIIDSCNANDVVEKLIELYPDEIASKNSYIDLVNRLKNTEPYLKLEHEGGQLTVYVSHVFEEDDANSYDAVSGYSFSNNTSYACEFMPHNEWLSMLVAEASLKHYGINEFLAHVLWEMTFVSFDEDEIKEEIDYIKFLAEDLKEFLERNDFESNQIVKTLEFPEFTEEEKLTIDNLMKKNQNEVHKMLGIKN